MAINVAKIQAELDLDSGSFHGKMVSASGEVTKFNKSIRTADRNLDRMRRRVTGFGSALRDTMIIMGQFRAAVYTLWTFTGQWVNSIIDANAKLERLQMLMQGLSKSTTYAGQVAEGLENMNYILDKARNAPFTVDALADSFVKLKASGLDPTMGAIEGLTEATARFGGSSETLHRASIAVQQMAGKGVISMEELRQQLGEAVPNAMMMMAHATNMSMGELVKIVASGRLEATTALRKLFLEMRIQYEGSAERMMTTWTGMLQKLKTEWMLFAKEIGANGLFDAAKRGLQDIMDFMKSADGRNFARDLGDGLKTVIEGVMNFAKWLIKNRGEIMSWGRAVMSTLGGIWDVLVKFSGTLKTIAALMVGAFVANKVSSFAIAASELAVRISTLNTRFLELSKVAATARTSMSAWAAVVQLAAGPIGIAVAAIAGLVFWLHKQKLAAREAQVAIMNFYEATSMGQAVSPEEFKQQQDRLAYLRKVEEFLKRANKANRLDRSKETFALLQEGEKLGFVDPDQLMTVAQGVDKLREVVSTKMEETTAYLSLQARIQADKTATEYSQSFLDKMRDADQKILAGTSASINEIQAQIDSGAITQAEGTKRRTAILTDAMQDRIDRLVAAKESLEKDMKFEFNPSILRQQEIMLNGVNDILRQAYEDRKTVLEDIKLLPKMNPFGAEGQQKKDPLQSYLESLMGKIGKLRGEIEDTNPTLEQFQELLKAGRFGKPSDSMIAMVKEQIEVLKSLQDQKVLKKVADDLKELEASAASDVMLARLESSNEMYAKVSVNMVRFNRQIAIMRNNWLQAGGALDKFNDMLGDTKASMAELDFISLDKFVRESEWAAYLDSLPDRERALAEFNKRLQENQQMIESFKKDDPNRAAEIDALGARNAAAIRQQYENATRPAWRNLLDDWKDTTTAFNNLWADSMGQFASTLVDAVVTGKASFKDLATSILKEITRILLSKALAQLVEIMINAFGPGSGTSGGGGGVRTTGPRAAKGAYFADGVARFADGGVFTNKLINRATVAPMAMFGEAGPEAIMPLARDGSGKLGVELMGGAGGVVNQISISVQVNQDGSSSSDVQGTGNAARELGALVDTRVRDTMAKEMRPGGLLWRMRNGG